MPQPPKVAKAVLQEISWRANGSSVTGKRKVSVQFNPESLKVAFSNSIAGGDQAGGAAIQYAGKGTTKLTFELWFDVTSPDLDKTHQGVTDVRRITAQVAQFMQAKKVGSGRNAKYYPPGVRMLWGSFLFEGVMESINETLEYFSEDGVPLRASVAVSLTKQDVDVKFGKSDADVSRSPGGEKTDAAKSGESLQQAEAKKGNPRNWPQRAQQNNIENPRHIEPGTRLSQ